VDNLTQWWAAFERALSASLVAFGEYLPTVVAALAVMLVGWIAARLLRAMLLRSGGALNSVIARIGRPMTASGAALSRRLVMLSANLSFWIVILVSAAIAARVAGLDAFSVWLDRLVDYLPTLVAGVLIALAGYLLSALVRDVVSTALVSIGSRENELAGLAAQVTVFVTALVIGLDQIGIDVTFLIILVAVLVGGALLSMAFAFGFGARDFVSNLIAAKQIQGLLEPGVYARVGDVEGRVLEVTPTAIIIVNDSGRVLVPAGLLQRQAAAILSSEGDE
jgi:Mechanosensitive ion channel, conserved TM helix